MYGEVPPCNGECCVVSLFATNLRALRCFPPPVSLFTSSADSFARIAAPESAASRSQGRSQMPPHGARSHRVHALLRSGIRGRDRSQDHSRETANENQLAHRGLPASRKTSWSRRNRMPKFGCGDKLSQPLARRGTDDCRPPAPKIEFSSHFQRDTPCPVPAAKIFLFPPTPTQHYKPRVPPPLRGAYRDRHGRWVRDAVDARGARDVRASIADGESVWS